MVYQVTQGRMGAVVFQEQMAVMGPEETLGSLALGRVVLGTLDELDLLGQRDRRETLSTSLTTAMGVYPVCQDWTVNLVHRVLMGQLVSLVQVVPTDTQVPQASPAPQGPWGAVAMFYKEREETRVTWVFPDPVVLLATGR